MTDTALAKTESAITIFRGQAIGELVKLPVPPPNSPCEQAEWDSLSVEQRFEMLQWFASEEHATTDGVHVTFPRIKYPTSGSSFWEIPTGGDKPEPVAELEAVILEKAECRVYYPAGAEVAEGTPPTCMSADTIKPDPEIANPQSPTCGDCPHARWGSGKDGEGQACKTRIRTYMLLHRPDPKDPTKGQLEQIPTFVSLPPTALRDFSQYVVLLAKQDKALAFHVTRLGLEKAKSKGGKEFSKLDAKLGRKLTLLECKAVKQAKETYGRLMRWQTGAALASELASDRQMDDAESVL